MDSFSIPSPVLGALVHTSFVCSSLFRIEQNLLVYLDLVLMAMTAESESVRVLNMHYFFKANLAKELKNVLKKRLTMGSP